MFLDIWLGCLEKGRIIFGVQVCPYETFIVNPDDQVQEDHTPWDKVIFPIDINCRMKAVDKIEENN